MNDALPIHEIRESILAATRQHSRLVVQAPTGSGKSTQIPQMLLDSAAAPSGQIVILQPRRLATRMLAARVAFERGSRLGVEVGYQVRFENVTSPETRIRFVTEGVLLRQMLEAPALPNVSTILFDEFHERHLYGDITLARALDLQATVRPDLRVMVMSATLETDALEQYLHPCAVLRSEGRTFEVAVRYLPRRLGAQAAPVWELAADAFVQQVRAGLEGDVLIFMPGSYEINQTLAALRQHPEARHHVLLPLHGDLAPSDQDAAVVRYDRPKIVVATNVAETSLTIDGIRLVIDSGLARIPRYDPTRGLNTLLIEKISQAAAQQRAGRAGRTAPGLCLRLWSAEEHQERPPHELPEVKRLDLAEVVLTLKASGVQDLRAFRWLEPPAEPALIHAEQLLLDLGALQVVPAPTSGGVAASSPAPSASRTAITALGRKMLAFPVHPRYARMLLAAHDFGCVHQACLIAALTQDRDLLIRNPGRDALAYRDDLFGSRATSDFWIRMRAYSYAARSGFSLEPCRRAGIHALTARQVGPLLDRFLRIAREEGLDPAPKPVPDESLQKCILLGFSDRVARRLDTGSLRCESVRGGRGVLARESAVHDAPLFVAAEIHEIEGADKSTHTLFSLATAISADWLEALFPGDLQTQTRVFFDPALRRVCAERLLRFRDLLLETKRIDPPPLDRAAGILADEIHSGRLALPRWDHAVNQWILRLNLLAHWCPELSLPPLTDADRRHVIERLCQDACSYREIKDRDVLAAVRDWLSPAQQEQLDRHAPTRLRLSNGREPRVTYAPDAPPFIALRIQELFDVRALPRIASGRTAIVAHILAPNMRPVQITQDLEGFWRDHYPRIKSELQRKYPKHIWH